MSLNNSLFFTQIPGAYATSMDIGKLWEARIIYYTNDVLAIGLHKNIVVTRLDFLYVVEEFGALMVKRADAAEKQLR